MFLDVNNSSERMREGGTSANRREKFGRRLTKRCHALRQPKIAQSENTDMTQLATKGAREYPPHFVLAVI